MKIKKDETIESQPKPRKEEYIVKSINSIVFDSFKKLTSDNKVDRIVASLQLLQYLSKLQKTSSNIDDEKQNKELNYALKRLIRGVGSSTTESRAGFFTTLVGFLQTTTSSSDSITITEILKIVKKELKASASVKDKIEADAVVGQMLTCGALIRSNKINQATTENIVKVIEILVKASKHRSYHNTLAYSFIIELIQKVNEQQFIEAIWPILQNEILIPWPTQNINTIHCIIVVQQKYPNLLNGKLLKLHLGGKQLLHPDSYQYLRKIFWENTNVGVVVQPGFECFAISIANCKNLTEFWTTEVNNLLDAGGNISKLTEIQTLKILTDILMNCNPNQTLISAFLTENFMKMITNSLRTIKTKNDETLKAFYDEFFEALQLCCSKLTGDENLNDCEKVEIIQKLILHPGILNIEKFTSNRVVHQLIASLKENGVKQIFEIYKNIFLNKIPKNPADVSIEWLNVERQNAGYVLQTLIGHKSVQTAFEWRAEQLKLFMKLGLFYTNSNLDIVKQSTTNTDEWLNLEYAEQMKNIFFASLQSKMPRLKDEKATLVELIELCNGILVQKSYLKYFRNRIDEKIHKVWQNMYNKVMAAGSKSKKNDKLLLVFHILLLHMGLQLFREPEMAESAIMDLEKCMDKTKQKIRSVKIDEKLAATDDGSEPEWIEVVVDLFLHLLSQNNSALRNIVNSVFPHLCDSLTLTAVHQILTVLEMKDGFNPLSENDNEGTEANADDDDDGSEDSLSDKEDVGNDEDEDDDGEDDESSDEDIVDEEEATETDKLRNAVSIALGTIGKDADQESVDLDDMDEEDGQKLDEALAEAFRAMRKSNESSKRSKGFRVQTTTIMHFRIRVLDLIEIYLQNTPSFVIALEILINLFNMIEYCTEKDLLPLANKVDKVLNKLTGLRQFTNSDDINEQNLCDYLRLVIEKKIRSSSFEAHNKIRSKCCHFLILNSKQLQNCENNLPHISQMFTEYLSDFIKSRNPIVNITLLADIFRMRWSGIWNLAKILTENGLCESTRTYRRIQIIELFENLYRNHELIRQNLKLAKKTFQLIENCMEVHINYLMNCCQQKQSQQQQISAREFTTILDFYVTSNRCHNKIELKPIQNKELLCERIQGIRRQLKMDTTQSYSRFSNVFGLKMIKNSDVIIPTPATSTVLTNGHHADHQMNCNEIIAPITDGKKRKLPTENNYRKEKKLKKEERMKKSSKGFNGGFSFTDAPIDANISDGSEHEDDNDDDSNSSDNSK